MSGEKNGNGIAWGKSALSVRFMFLTIQRDNKSSNKFELKRDSLFKLNVIKHPYGQRTSRKALLYFQI